MLIWYVYNNTVSTVWIWYVMRMAGDHFYQHFIALIWNGKWAGELVSFFNNLLINWSQVSCALSCPAAERLHLSIEILCISKWAKYEFIHISPERKLWTHFHSRLQAWAISISLCNIFMSFAYFFILSGRKIDLFSCMADRRQCKKWKFWPALNTKAWPFDMKLPQGWKGDRGIGTYSEMPCSEIKTFCSNRAIKLHQYSAQVGLLEWSSCRK